MTTNATVPVTQQKAVTKIDSLKSILNADSVKEQFKNALKENSSLFVASVIDLFNGDTNLQNCDPKEVVMEALKAAVLKLPINKSLGFAWIIPYNNSVKDPQVPGGWKKVMKPGFQIGYKGYIQLAMRTGQYRIINTDMVYEGELKTINKLTGEIDFSGEKTSDKVVGYFAHIEMINGFSKTLFWKVEKVARHAKTYSQSIKFDKNVTIESLIASAGQSNESTVVGWKGNFDGMAIKTVLSNLISHYGYLSIEMVGAMDSDITTDTKEQHHEEVRNNANAQTVDFEEVPTQQIEESVDETTGEVIPANEPVAANKPGF